MTDRLLRRLILLGLLSTAGGLAVAARGRTPAQRAFGGQSAGWGAADLGTVAAGAWLVARAPSLRGRRTPEQARGHGTAVALQGLALLAIDAAHARALAPGPTTRGA